MHNTIGCNQWLKRIKIKESDTCSFSNLTDDIAHFFINCENTNTFPKTWGLWWERLTNIRECEHIIEHILFNKNNTIIIDVCIMHATYFIYQTKIKNDNKIEFVTYLFLLKKYY